jgi:hypothetical protein
MEGFYQTEIEEAKTRKNSTITFKKFSAILPAEKSSLKSLGIFFGVSSALRGIERRLA